MSDLRANLSKENVDVTLTSCQCHVNICKSILDVKSTESFKVDAENGIFQKSKC